MTNNESEFELTAQCLCKAQTFTCTVARSALPLDTTLCHCDSCRHMTGAMHSSGVDWPGPVEHITQSSLAVYEFSKTLNVLFCAICSSPMFWRWYEEDGTKVKYHAFRGALKNDNVPGIIELNRNIFVGDTRDGGAAVWLQSLGQGDGPEKQIPCWTEWKEKSALVDPETMSAKTQTVLDQIPVHCHCKGVDLVLKTSTATAEFAALARDKLPWFVDPESHKLLASFDACDSCRLVTGVDVLNWTYTLLRHLDYAPSTVSSSKSSSFPATTPELKAAVDKPDPDGRLGTLAYYCSSPDVQRYFCSKCSATVFYAVDSRPEMVDLAVGLLDAPDGARAESAITWGLGMMVWKNDVKGGWRKPFVDSVQKNAEAWRVKSGKKKTWAVIAREEREAAA